MKYVLTCDCGNTDFTYEDDSFRCRNCNNVYTSDDADEHLLDEPMKYVLTCDCGNTDFAYEDDSFRCKECGIIYADEDAGKHLLGDIGGYYNG